MVRTRPRSTLVRRSVAALAVMTAASVVLVRCTAAPPPSAAGPPPPPAASPRASAPPAPADPPSIDPVTAAELGASWRPGCPVGPEQLRRVGVDHIGFDNQTHRGQLIVHEELVSQVITIFEQLYQLRYPREDGGIRPLIDEQPTFQSGTLAPRAHSNRRMRRHTWTAAAPTRAFCIAAIPPYTSSPIEVGSGAATGGLPSTTCTSSGPDRASNRRATAAARWYWRPAVLNYDRSDRTEALRELRRVLHPTGALVLSRQHPTGVWLRHGASAVPRRGSGAVGPSLRISRPRRADSFDESSVTYRHASAVARKRL